MVIAIDGPAGAGKSSVARAVAAGLGFTYLDSGAMYRCVALAALERAVDLDDAVALGSLAGSLRIELDGERVVLDGRDVGEAIRTPRVTEASSRVSVHQPVREAMVAAQRRLIEAGRYVAEGRDIGTVVSPEAPLKVFLTASAEDALDAAPRRPARRRPRCSPPSASATSATRPASTAPCAPPPTRSRSTPPASRSTRSSSGSSP